MARTKRKRTYRRKTKIPVAVIGGMIPLVATALSDFQSGGIQGLRNTVTAIVPYSPANRSFTTARLHLGLYPMLAGFIVHKLASMFGVNRALASAGVPLIRI